MTTEETLVSTKEVDFLDEDKPIRNQNYCLLSFLSPEDVLINKETYYFSKFLDKFGKDMDTLLNNLALKYQDSKDLIETIKTNHSYIFSYKEMDEQFKFFKSVNSDEIEKDFHKENNFTTSIRGIKVRGVFDTIDEAKNRCEFLKKIDNKFDIYIGQVGCWCPWSPNPNDLQDQEYSETQLNTLMKQYKKNMEDRDEVFDKRKNENIAKGKKDDLADNLTDEDPWTARKRQELSQQEAKSEEAKSEEAKSEEAKSEEAKSEEAKPEEAKVEEVKSEEAKPEEAKSEEAKSEEVKAE